MAEAHNKYAMKMKETRKNGAHKNVFDGRKQFITAHEELVKRISTSFGSTILDTMKVLPYNGYFFHSGAMRK